MSTSSPSSTMYFQHTPDIRRDFPTLAAGALSVKGLHTNIDVGSDLITLYAQARERLQENNESQMPEIEAWRKGYAQMGFKPTQYRCAAESLLRRFRKEDSLPSFHPLVDLCNALSLAYAIPVAVFDIDHVTDFIEVRYASGDESYLDFSGEMQTPPEGEVIFADGAGQAHSRRWCYRQSKKSVMSPSTVNALIVTEALHEGASFHIQSLVSDLSEAVTRLYGPPAGSTFLSTDTPRFDF